MNETKDAMLSKISEALVAIEQARGVLQRATPLAHGLVLVKSLDKAVRGLEKIRAEIRSLQL